MYPSRMSLEATFEDKFCGDFFGDQKFPTPSAPLGCEITTTGFQQVVRASHRAVSRLGIH